MSFGTLYILDGANDPVPCEDVLIWSKWAGARGRRVVAEDEAGQAVVRTTFLGVNCQVQDDRPPLVFSSIVFPTIDRFGHQRVLASRFYETYNGSLLGHNQLVEAFEQVAGIIITGEKK